ATAQEMLADLETCLQPERLSEQKLVYEPEEDDAEKTIIMPAIREHMITTSSDQEGDTLQTQTRGRIADTLEDKPTRKRWIKPVVWLVVVIALFFGSWQGVKAFIKMMEVPEVEVPNVVGKPYEEAEAILTELNLLVQYTADDYSDEYEAGLIMWQSRSEILAKENSTIELTVS